MKEDLPDMKKEDDAENIRLLKLIAHIGIEEGLAWGGNWMEKI